MEDIHTIEKPGGKVYTERQIQVGAFIGGPLTAGYFFVKNYKIFGLDKRVLQTRLATTVLFVVVFAIAFSIPDNINFPNFVIPFIYTLLITLVFKQEMAGLVDEHISNNGESKSWGETIIASIIGLIITSAILIGVAFALFPDEFVEDAGYPMKTYGILKHEVYYEAGNITDKELDELAFALQKTEFFNNDFKTALFARKTDEGIEMDIILPEKNWNDFELVRYYSWLRSEVEFYLRPKTFKINLLDEDLSVQRKIE